MRDKSSTGKIPRLVPRGAPRRGGRAVLLASTAVLAVLATFAAPGTASARPIAPPPAPHVTVRQSTSGNNAVRPFSITGNIVNLNSWAQGSPNRCIGISNGLAGLWPCTSNSDQTWRWGACLNNDCSSNWRHIVNGNGACLAVNGASTNLNSRILGYPCGGSADQYWWYFSTGSGWANLVNYHGWVDGAAQAWLIGVAGGSTATGAALVLWSADGSDNQYWQY
jgi:hypothetical protein